MILSETCKAINLYDVQDLLGRHDQSHFKQRMEKIDQKLRAVVHDPNSNNEGMLYAIRNKPESILFYPSFKSIIA